MISPCYEYNTNRVAFRSFCLPRPFEKRGFSAETSDVLFLLLLRKRMRLRHRVFTHTDWKKGCHMIKVLDSTEFMDLRQPCGEFHIEADAKAKDVRDRTNKSDCLFAKNAAPKNSIDIEAIFQKRLLRQLQSSKKKTD